jgi:hypothetical protein
MGLKIHPAKVKKSEQGCVRSKYWLTAGGRQNIITRGGGGGYGFRTGK